VPSSVTNSTTSAVAADRLIRVNLRVDVTLDLRELARCVIDQGRPSDSRVTDGAGEAGAAAEYRGRAAGDVIEVEINQIGILRNVVADEMDAGPG
jgi:hypothetical protein